MDSPSLYSRVKIRPKRRRRERTSKRSERDGSDFPRLVTLIIRTLATVEMEVAHHLSSKYLLLSKILREKKSVSLRNFINEENRHRAAKIRGLSWYTKPSEVVEFF